MDVRILLGHTPVWIQLALSETAWELARPLLRWATSENTIKLSITSLGLIASGLEDLPNDASIRLPELDLVLGFVPPGLMRFASGFCLVLIIECPLTCALCFASCPIFAISIGIANYWMAHFWF